MTPTEFLADYNYYRWHTWRVELMRADDKPVRSVIETAVRLAALARMAAWGADRGLDPRHWLAWLFEVRHWRFAPPFHQLVPAAKREKAALKRYADVGEIPVYRRRITQAIQALQVAAGQVYDRNRDMSATTEALKRRYLAEVAPEDCMVDPRSLGYHPRSLVCGRCVQARECEARLRAGVWGFDIVSLRNGDTTTAQAQGEMIVRGRR